MKYTVLVKRETFATFEIEVDERDDETNLARNMRAWDIGIERLPHIRDVDLTIDKNRTTGWWIVSSTKTKEDTP